MKKRGNNLVENKDCIKLTKFIVENNLFDNDPIDIYNRWMNIVGANYSKRDTQWLLGYIDKIAKVDKRLLVQSIKIDSLDL